jgi:hypothetical protein
VSGGMGILYDILHFYSRRKRVFLVEVILTSRLPFISLLSVTKIKKSCVGAGQGNVCTTDFARNWQIGTHCLPSVWSVRTRQLFQLSRDPRNPFLQHFPSLSLSRDTCSVSITCGSVLPSVARKLYCTLRIAMLPQLNHQHFTMTHKRVHKDGVFAPIRQLTP